LNAGSGVGGNATIAETTITEATIRETMPGAALAAPGLSCGPETILLVEDEAFVRKATAEVLESAGYRLMTASSATEALEAYARCFRPVDLLLADVVMPGMNGHDLAAEFESLCPRVRVLLMSGHEEQLARCEQSRYSKKCLAKPFSIDTLLKRVREVLDGDANPFERGAQA
jgi:two-component system cell cycle sensor histidine kinase/response regulator CckA